MRISVYITSYNQKDYLKEAIESILSQTLKPFQVLIIDDCSSDRSQEMIGAFKTRYPDLITPIYHAHNRGIAHTRAEALGRITGEYVTYLDGDDRFLPGKLEEEGKLLKETPTADIAFSNVYYIDEAGNRTGIWAEDQSPPEGEIFCQTFARDFPKRNLFRSELVNYEAWKKIGFHDPNLQIYEDYDMRIRMTKNLQAVYHDEPLSEYRRHAGGLSRAKFSTHFHSLDFIYKKNSYLLDNLNDDERTYIRQRVNEWMTTIGKGAMDECCSEGKWFTALKFFRDARTYNPAVFSWSFFLNSLFHKNN